MINDLIQPLLGASLISSLIISYFAQGHTYRDFKIKPSLRAWWKRTAKFLFWTPWAILLLTIPLSLLIDYLGSSGNVRASVNEEIPTPTPNSSYVLPDIADLSQIDPSWPEVFSEVIPQLSGNITLVDSLAGFFDGINEAQGPDDLAPLWDYLAPEFQQSSNGGDKQKFIDFWWSVKVDYVIKQCKANVADVIITYYNRSDEGRFNATSQDYIRYSFEIREQSWQIVSGARLDRGASLCEE